MEIPEQIVDEIDLWFKRARILKLKNVPVNNISVWTLRAFTGCVPLEKTYWTGLTGGYDKTKRSERDVNFKRTKQSFDKDILNKLIELLKRIIARDGHQLTENDHIIVKRDFRKSVAKKLEQLNRHYEFLKGSTEFDEALKNYDDIGFKNYLKYRNNPNLFFQLDEEIDKK